MNNLKDIHNQFAKQSNSFYVVLSGFQWTIWRIYTTIFLLQNTVLKLFYQDFNEQFEGYTQRCRGWQIGCACCFIRISMNNLKDIHNGSLQPSCSSGVVLSGFQWTIWRIYTTCSEIHQLFSCCFIRISMNNLKDIHNKRLHIHWETQVVLSGFQWTILLQKYKKYMKSANLWENILLFQQKALPLHQQIWRIYTIRIIPLCKHSEWHASVALFLPFSHPCTHISLSLLSISSLLNIVYPLVCKMRP